MKKLSYRKLMSDSERQIKYKKFRCSKGHQWSEEQGQWLLILRQGGLRPYFINPKIWPPAKGVVLCNQCFQTHFPAYIEWAKKMCGEVYIDGEKKND